MLATIDEATNLVRIASVLKITHFSHYFQNMLAMMIFTLYSHQ